MQHQLHLLPVYFRGTFIYCVAAPATVTEHVVAHVDWYFVQLASLLTAFLFGAHHLLNCCLSVGVGRSLEGMWGYLPVLQRVQPDSTLALQAVTVSRTLRTDGDSPAGTTGAPVTLYQSGWYSTTGAPVAVCSLSPALRAAFMYLTAGQDDQRTGLPSVIPSQCSPNR